MKLPSHEEVMKGLDPRLVEFICSGGGRLDADMKQKLRTELEESLKQQGFGPKEREIRLGLIDAVLGDATDLYTVGARTIESALEGALHLLDGLAASITALAKSMKTAESVFIIGGVGATIETAVGALLAAKLNLAEAEKKAVWKFPEGTKP